MPSQCARSLAVPSGVAAYSGSYPIDHLEEAIMQGDDAVARHFFTALLPRVETHETIARILCQRNASILLTELFLAGYWPPADVVRELLGICAASASCHVMNELLELAADRGIACDALATGWVNALAGEGDTGTLIQRISQWFPGSVGIQAVARALEAAHPETLQAVITCLKVPPTDQDGSAIELEHAVAVLVFDCLDALSAGTTAVLLANGLDPTLRSTDGITLIECVFRVSTTEVQALFHQWINELPDGKAMNVYVLIGDDAAFARRCRSASDYSLVEFDAQAALMTALSRDHIALARVLLAMGADPDFVRESDGASSLTLASLDGHERLVCLLLQAGADTTHADAHGNTALHYCAVRGDIDLCARLLRSGAVIDARNPNNGHTALSLACLLGRHRDDHSVVGFLVEMGADVEAQDAQGRSPIALASMTDQAELVDILLRCGAVGNGVSAELMPGRSVPGIKNFTGVKGIVGFKSIALKMISLLERSRNPGSDPTSDLTERADADGDYDQAA